MHLGEFRKVRALRTSWLRVGAACCWYARCGGWGRVWQTARCWADDNMLWQLLRWSMGKRLDSRWTRTCPENASSGIIKCSQDV